MDVRLRHWPYVGLAVAAVLSLVYYLERGWLFASDDWVFWVHIPVLMVHQFEEYGYPGGFKTWWNGEVWDSGDDDFPLDWKTSAKINVLGGWLPFTVMALIGSNWGGALLIVPFLGIMGNLHNAWFHVTYTVSKSYSPGVLTSLGLYLPLTTYASFRFFQTGQISLWELIVAFVVGGLIHANIFRVMRKRMDERRIG